MKTFKMKWLPIFLLATIGFIFSSCEGNLNNPDEYPEGVITLKMRNAYHGKTTLDLLHEDKNYGYLYISYDNNFTYYSNIVTYRIKICDAGNRKIGSVKSIPTSGWTNELAVIPEHTYVVKITAEGNNEMLLPEFYDKIYVVDYIKSTDGEIIGAEVKYCEWDPQQ